MTISPFTFWMVVGVLILQALYNLDGWRIYGHGHRGLAALACALTAAALIIGALA